MNLNDRLKQHLEEGVIGFPTALASAIGLILASPVILTVTTGFGIGGGAFAIAMLIALLMMLCQATTFAEAAAILPTSGSVYDYISCGLGRFFAITGTISAYLLVHAFAGTAETILSGIMATVNFEAFHAMLDKTNTEWLVGVGLVVIFGVVNFFGITAFSKAEIVLTMGMYCTLMIFGISGLIQKPLVPQAGWFGATPAGTDFTTVLSLVGMAVFMFVGGEFVTPLAPELKNSARNIPRAMLIGLFSVAVCMFIYGAALGRQVVNIAVNAEGTVHLLETPGAIPRFAEQIMGPFGKIWLGIGFLFAGAATINTLMAGLPRILYGMALDGALPKAFSYLHPRFKTPVVGIAVAVAIPCCHAWYLKGNLDKIMHLVLAAVCAWGVAYLLVTLSVVSLRIRRPDLPRAYKSPFFPIPQIISSVGILIALWYITPPGMNPRDIYVPFGVMLGLVAVYALVWTVMVQRINPFKPVPVEDILEEEFSRNDMTNSEIEHAHIEETIPA
jgi:amino acid transporter